MTEPPGQNPLTRWSSEIAIVTGATSGIGAAVARRLLSAGIRVAALGRRRTRMAELAHEGGSNVLPVFADLRDPRAIDEAFNTVNEHWGVPRLLINNAGMGRETSLIDGDPEDWEAMMGVNVMGLARCTQRAVAGMRANGDRGHVINISSLSAYRVVGRAAFYAATKHAVRALTEGLRQELRSLDSAIRVSAVSPGFVQTEFHEGYYGSRERAEELYRRHALDPSDIADAVEHMLAAPERVEIHDLLVRPTAQPT